MSPSSPQSDLAKQGYTESKQDSLRSRWSALHAKSCRIAQMADLAPEKLDDALSRFDAAFAEPYPTTLTIAQSGIEDIEILLEMGLTALGEVEARGQDPNAPALALWREFYHAREAVLAIAQPAAA